MGNAFGGFVQLSNQTINNTQYFNSHNCAVTVKDITLISTAKVSVTSNTEVDIKDDFNAVLNPEFNAYIAPAICNGGSNPYAARSANPNNNSNAPDANSDVSTRSENIITEKETTQQTEKNKKTSQNFSNRIPLKQKELQFSIKPNPTNGSFKITFNTDSPLPLSIKVIDVLGKLVYENYNLASTEIEVNLNNFQTGVYNVTINYQDNFISQRVVKTE